MKRRKFLAASGSIAAFGGTMMTTSAEARLFDFAYFELPGAPRLQIRRRGRKDGPPVLYIHGSTFPSALSVGYRFADGKSWEDLLDQSGFDVWALDFEGFGGSDRPREFDLPADSGSIPLLSSDAERQIERASDFVRHRTHRERLSIIAHSWGGVCAARYACKNHSALEKLVFFAPPITRPASSEANQGVGAEPLPAWQLVTLADQMTRFVKDTPPGHRSVLAEPTLRSWGPAWLATDPKSNSREPPSVQVPGGFGSDLDIMWGGGDVYDPADIKTPTLIVRGEWDSVCSAADVERLQSRMTNAKVQTQIIPESGHLAHLETNRAMLWATVNAYLKAAVPK
jgi:pimeloyl-ACP methyl ester carboxylesterase